ncbi:hypothetical protein [Gracilimonas sp.]|uniref:hypothetical protein n=1 Tax=Gracilimonas sp. TaxID=1974203 RepID=UPI002871A798|nr:hypothetical protein [Gracilimonas sp.]
MAKNDVRPSVDEYMALKQRGSTNIQDLVKQGDYYWVNVVYKHYNKVWEIERDESSTRLGEKLLWDLHYLKSMSKDEFVEQIKSNQDFANKWGDLSLIYEE